MKREKREEIVKKGVVEHERLSQQFHKKEKELRRQYDELRKRFDEEKVKVKLWTTPSIFAVHSHRLTKRFFLHFLFLFFSFLLFLRK